jgi:hypothetical protein
MDQATLVLSALIICILQVITLVMVLSIARKLRTPESSSPSYHGAPPEKERRDEAPHDRRPQQKKPLPPIARAKTPPPQTQQPVASVDKTLRDINLRLKNAERNQERVRKQFNDGPRDPNSPREPNGPRDTNGPRDSNRSSGGRFDRNDRGRGGRGGEHRRNDRQDRGDRSGQYARNDAMRPSEPNENLPPAQEPEALPPIMAPSGDLPAAAPMEIDASAIQSESADTLTHGRKVLVKRRSLKEEEGATEAEASPDPASSTSEPSTTSATESAPPASPSEPNAGGDEISFGRRF